MRTIHHYGSDVLHIEIPLGIVNVKSGLRDEGGRRVTGVEILPDKTGAHVYLEGYSLSRLIQCKPGEEGEAQRLFTSAQRKTELAAYDFWAEVTARVLDKDTVTPEEVLAYLQDGLAELAMVQAVDVFREGGQEDEDGGDEVEDGDEDEDHCAQCGKVIVPDPAGSEGVFVHAGEDGPDIDRDHVPVRYELKLPSGVIGAPEGSCPAVDTPLIVAKALPVPPEQAESLGRPLLDRDAYVPPASVDMADFYQAGLPQDPPLTQRFWSLQVGADAVVAFWAYEEAWILVRAADVPEVAAPGPDKDKAEKAVADAGEPAPPEGSRVVRVTLARLVREYATIRVRVPEGWDHKRIGPFLSEVYSEYSDGTDDWTPDYEWGSDQGTHEVLTEDGDSADDGDVEVDLCGQADGEDNQYNARCEVDDCNNPAKSCDCGAAHCRVHPHDKAHPHVPSGATPERTWPQQKRDAERTQLEALSGDELDERVHDAKSAEAASINNQGREAQIAYLLS